MRVVVIGSGLLGLTTAFFLSREGVEVTVVDRERGPGLSTSYANGGMLHASQANPWNEPGVLGHALRMLGREDAALLIRLRALPSLLGWGWRFVQHSNPARYLQNFEKNARLARHSLAVMETLRREVPGNYDFDARGTLKLFRTREAVAAAREMCRQLDAWGIEFEAVDGRRAVELEPALAPIESRLAGGLYFPQDESGDAHRFCVMLWKACENRGVRFRFNLPVKQLLRAGQHVEGVMAGKDFLQGDAYVLAAGSHSLALAKGVGVSLPLRPVKGYSVTLPMGDWAGRPEMPVIDDSLHAAVCPLGDRLRVAGTAEFAGFDLRLTPSRIENLFRLVTKLYPDFEPHLDREKAGRWCGLRPMSADGVGLMGGTALGNFFLNTGHGPLGWTMAAAAGQLVAHEVLGRKPAFDPSPYRLARFD